MGLLGARARAGAAAESLRPVRARNRRGAGPGRPGVPLCARSVPHSGLRYRSGGGGVWASRLGGPGAGRHLGPAACEPRPAAAFHRGRGLLRGVGGAAACLGLAAGLSAGGGGDPALSCLWSSATALHSVRCWACREGARLWAFKYFRCIPVNKHP